MAPSRAPPNQTAPPSHEPKPKGKSQTKPKTRNKQNQAKLQRQGASHGQPYDDDHAAYLFALNTHVALVAKIVAALALPQANQDLRNAVVPVRTRFETLESGQIFFDAGIANLLNGDFFSWYLEPTHFSQFEPSPPTSTSSLHIPPPSPTFATHSTLSIYTSGTSAQAHT